MGFSVRNALSGVCLPNLRSITWDQELHDLYEDLPHVLSSFMNKISFLAKSRRLEHFLLMVALNSGILVLQEWC